MPVAASLSARYPNSRRIIDIKKVPPSIEAAPLFFTYF